MGEGYVLARQSLAKTSQAIEFLFDIIYLNNRKDCKAE